MSSPAGSLLLDNQLCFPLYAAARAIQQRYRPLLEPLGLTYPQYLVMLVLWEQEGIPVKSIGGRLRLDSGTLTPLLKRLESAGIVRRERQADDNRVVLIHLTDAGRDLQARAASVPGALLACVAPQAEQHHITALKAQLDGLLQMLTEDP